jgi:hypothetical protein
MARNSRDEGDYLSSVKASAGSEASVCSRGAQDRASSSSRGGPTAYLYPAAMVVAALLLLIMAAV